MTSKYPDRKTINSLYPDTHPDKFVDRHHYFASCLIGWATGHSANDAIRNLIDHYNNELIDLLNNPSAAWAATMKNTGRQNPCTTAWSCLIYDNSLSTDADHGKTIVKPNPYVYTGSYWLYLAWPRRISWQRISQSEKDLLLDVRYPT